LPSLQPVKQAKSRLKESRLKGQASDVFPSAELLLNLEFPNFLGVRFMLEAGKYIHYHRPLVWPDYHDRPLAVSIRDIAGVEPAGWTFVPWIWCL
jgi:hypothetical protein